MQGSIRLQLLTVAIFVATACNNVSGGDAGFRKFDRIFEPSGVLQLPDGRFLVVEDESSQPISVFTLDADGKTREQALWRRSLTGWLSANRGLRSLEDLEDVSLDAAGRVVAITSHSRKEGGRRDIEREHMVRFTLRGDDVRDLEIRRGLRKAIRRVHDSLKDATRVRDAKDEDGFNIEGLSFDRDRKRLLIGLRGPIVDERAVIVTLLNPDAVFDDDAKPEISEQLILLELDKGGIRGMAWDPHLGGFLIISRRPEKKFKLWLWDGHADSDPRRLDSAAIGKLRQAEGVTPVVRDGRPAGVLIVSDEGDGIKGKPGRYVFIPYDELSEK